MTSKLPKLRAVDFFCGGGGMSLGMSKAGIEIVAGIDNDPACRATYTANHPDSEFIGEDITDYAVEDLGKVTGISQSEDNMIFIGCSPCQYWSVITGKNGSVRKEPARKGRNLLRDFLRFVDYYRPGFVAIENVLGIDRNSETSGLADLLAFFDEAGYKYKSDVLSANHFGVPQTRRRFVLLASRVLDSISLPKPDKEIALIRDAIGGKKRQPSIKAGECDANDKLHKSPKLSETNIERLKLTPQGCGREHWHEREDLQIDAYRGKSKEFFAKITGVWHGMNPRRLLPPNFMR